MSLVDGDLLPCAPVAFIAEPRKTYPAILVIVLITHLDARQQATFLPGADAYISKR
jgi:hypothetical protein